MGTRQGLNGLSFTQGVAPSRPGQEIPSMLGAQNEDLDVGEEGSSQERDALDSSSSHSCELDGQNLVIRMY